MFRRLTLAIAIAVGASLAGPALAVASPASTQAPPAVGPECNATTGTAVLVAVASLGLPAGSKVQYLEVYQTAAGTYAVRPCVVTVS